VATKPMSGIRSLTGADSGVGLRVAALAAQVAEFNQAKASANPSTHTFGMLEEEVAGVCPDIAFLLPSERERFKEWLRREGITVGRHPRKRTRLLFVYTQDETDGVESAR